MVTQFLQYMYTYLGQKFINEDKVSYFNALKYEKDKCEPFPAFDDEATDVEVAMEIEEDHASDDEECYSEDAVSQRQAETEFKLEKTLQRTKKLFPKPEDQQVRL